VTGQWFSSGTPVSSTNKADHHDLTEIVLKVVLNTKNQTRDIREFTHNMHTRCNDAPQID
jgi:hypothetical protein